MFVAPPLSISFLMSAEKSYTLSNDSENSVELSNCMDLHGEAQAINFRDKKKKHTVDWRVPLICHCLDLLSQVCYSAQNLGFHLCPDQLLTKRETKVNSNFKCMINPGLQRPLLTHPAPHRPQQEEDVSHSQISFSGEMEADSTGGNMGVKAEDVEMAENPFEPYIESLRQQLEDQDPVFLIAVIVALAVVVITCGENLPLELNVAC